MYKTLNAYLRRKRWERKNTAIRDKRVLKKWNFKKAEATKDWAFALYVQRAERRTNKL